MLIGWLKSGQGEEFRQESTCLHLNKYQKRQKIILTLCTFQLFWKSFVTGTQLDLCRNFPIILGLFHINFTTLACM